MLSRRLRSAILVLSASVGLAGCAGMYGSPYGTGVSVGYGNGYDPYYSSGYYDRYGRPIYGSGYGAYDRYGRPIYGSGYGYGYQPYNGWYDGYYYPGTGYYVYDRAGRRERWSEAQKRYWESRGEGITVVNRDGSPIQQQQQQNVIRERTSNRMLRVARPTTEQRQSVRTERQGIRQATREERQQVRQSRREAREENRKKD